MENIVNTLSKVPWELIGSLLVTTGIVSVLLQKFKNWFKLQSDKVIVVMLGLLSFIPAALDYVNSVAAENPLVLGRNTLVIMGLSQPLYRFVIKPLTDVLIDAKAERARREEANAPLEVVVAPKPEEAVAVAKEDVDAGQLLDIDLVEPEHTVEDFPS